MTPWLEDAYRYATDHWPEVADAIDLLLDKKSIEAKRIRSWIMKQHIKQDCPPRSHGLDFIMIKDKTPGRTEFSIWQLAQVFAHDYRLSKWDQMSKREREAQAKRMTKAALTLIQGIDEIDSIPATHDLLMPISALRLLIPDRTNIPNEKLQPLYDAGLDGLDNPEILREIIYRIAFSAIDAVDRKRPVSRFKDRKPESRGHWSTPEIRLFARHLHHFFVREFGTPADSIVVEALALKHPQSAGSVTPDLVRTWTGRKPG